MPSRERVFLGAHTWSRRRAVRAGLGVAAGLLWPGWASAYSPGDDIVCGTAQECDEWQALAKRIDTEILPIPDGNPPPLSSLSAPGGIGFEGFRKPFPPVPVWNPPGMKRVGLQAGHWKFADSPDELVANRQNPGTSGGGKAEWQVNLDIVERTAPLLRERGILVDLLDGTPPIRYRAHAFVAIHCDGDASGVLRGYKVSNSVFSATPAVDNVLVESIWDEYELATGLARDPQHVSRRMTGYYAFNARRYQHAIAPGVPHSILECAFLTNPQDRQFLFTETDRVARGVANGILRFLALGGT